MSSGPENEQAAATTEARPEPRNRGGTVWDWPNQQVVRPNNEGPGVDTPPEGVTASAAAADESEADDLDAMTKDELLAYAQSIGASPANASMNKDEIRASIDAAESE